MVTGGESERFLLEQSFKPCCEVQMKVCKQYNNTKERVEWRGIIGFKFAGGQKHNKYINTVYVFIKILPIIRWLWHRPLISTLQGLLTPESTTDSDHGSRYLNISVDDLVFVQVSEPLQDLSGVEYYCRLLQRTPFRPQQCWQASWRKERRSVQNLSWNGKMTKQLERPPGNRKVTRIDLYLPSIVLQSPLSA